MPFKRIRDALQRIEAREHLGLYERRIGDPEDASPDHCKLLEIDKWHITTLDTSQMWVDRVQKLNSTPSKFPCSTLRQHG